MPSALYLERNSGGILRLIVLLFLICKSAFGYSELSSWTVVQSGRIASYKLGEDLVTGPEANSKAIFNSVFSSKKLTGCKLKSDCWLFLGEVADTASVKLNGVTLASYQYYAHYESILVYLPSSLLKDENHIQVEVSDLNQDRFGLRNRNLGIGTKDEVDSLSTKDWIMRTGSPLLSSATLLVLFLGLLATYSIYRKSRILPLLGLASIGSLYLISFSELPRRIFDPLFLSGPVHFVLRLSVDLCVIFVALSLYKTNKFSRWIQKLPYGYYASILAMLGGWFYGIRNYEFYKDLMLLVAPLVAGGSIALMILFLGYFDKKEKRIIAPFYSAYLIFQLHDLQIFWDLKPGNFTIKWYLPFVVLAFTWIYVRRRINESKAHSLNAAIGERIQKISHDISAPLEQLKSLLQLDFVNNERLHRPVQEISTVIESCLARNVIPRNDLKGIKEVAISIAEKFDTLSVEVSFERSFDWLMLDSSLLIRTFNNLLSNAQKAGATKVSIRGLQTDRSLSIFIEDNGAGIPLSFQPYVFDAGVTTDLVNGHGIGLSSCLEQLQEYGLCLTLQSSNPGQTIFVISVPLKVIALIDDNSLTRDTWTELGSAKNIQVLTYPTFENFLISPPPKNSPVFVDKNLGSDNGLLLAPKIKKMGFNFIVITSGERSVVSGEYGLMGKAFPF
jgi:signal transduction histidine kinase